MDRDAPRSPIDLQVETPQSVRGRIVDARTNEPVSGARIQAWTSYSQTLIDHSGTPVESGPDGTFVLGSLAPGRAFASVTHARYAQSVEAFDVVAGRIHDCGLIALTTGGTLIVQLESSPDSPCVGIRCHVEGLGAIEPKTFTADGVLEFAGLAPGLWNVALEMPDGSRWQRTCTVRGDAPYRLVFGLRARPLIVEVLAKPGVALPEQARLLIRPLGRDRDASQEIYQKRLAGPTTVKLSAVDADGLYLSVLDDMGREHAAMAVHGSRQREEPVRFFVDGAPASTRLVDRLGQPLGIDGVLVCRFDEGWSVYHPVGAESRVHLSNPPCEHVSMFVHRAGVGYGAVHEVPCDPLPDEVRFDFRSLLEVTLVDGAVPLPGKIVFLEDGTGAGHLIENLPTDEHGLAVFGPLTEDDYLVRVEHSTLWPHAERVRATGARVPLRLDVRRRGSALVTAIVGGVVAAESGFELVSEEFGSVVVEWIERGLITSTTAGLNTDDQGRVRLDGLPRGGYRWSMAASDGSTASGRFEVRAGQRVDVSIQCP
jgi:hypothetical protein